MTKESSLYERFVPEKFRVYSLDRPEHVDELRAQHLMPAHHYGKKPEAYQEDNAWPAYNLLDHAISLGAKTALVELRYVDRDYKEAYGRFYVHQHRTHSPLCKRVRFFRSRLSLNDLEDLSPHQGDDSYMGFTVVRGIDVFKTGRTVLPPRDDKQTHFTFANALYSVDIMGYSLQARGSLFTQQEPLVGCCASAATYISVSALLKQFGGRTHSLSAITDMATQFTAETGRAMPSAALSAQQVMLALRSCGYEPVIHGFADWRWFQTVLYSYNESGLPAILFLASPLGGEGHAVTVVGHRYGRPQDTAKEVFWRKDLPDAESWVSGFYAHDDRLGPYVTMDFLDPKRLLSDKERPKKEGKYLSRRKVEEYGFSPSFFLPVTEGDGDLLDYGERLGCPVKVGSDPQMWNALVMVVPLPAGVVLDANNARDLARKFFWQFCSAHDNKNPAAFVLRTYLVPSNEFKEQLSTRQPPISREAALIYRSMHMPRFIWLTELLAPESMDKDSPMDRLVMGEMLLDSTAHPQAMRFLGVHAQGFMHWMTPEDDDMLTCLNRYEPVPVTTGYGRHRRKA